MSRIAALELIKSGAPDILFKGTKNEVIWFINKLLAKGIVGIEIKKL